MSESEIKLNLIISDDAKSDTNLDDLFQSLKEKYGENASMEKKEVKLDGLSQSGTKSIDGEIVMQFIHIISASHVTLMLIKELYQATKETKKLLKKKPPKVKVADNQGNIVEISPDLEIEEIKRKLEALEQGIKGIHK